MHRPTRRASRGFSFVEILFAVFLLGICASIVIATMPVANISRERANRNNIATGVAQKQIEAIRGRGYANASSTQLLAVGLIDSTTEVSPNAWAFTNSDAANGDSVANLMPGATGFVRVEQVSIDLRRVTVVVTYPYRGRNQTVTLGTMIANL